MTSSPFSILRSTLARVTAVAVVASLIPATSSHAASEACPSAMAESVEGHLLPVLQALNHARHQRGVWSRDDDAAFRLLLAANDADSAEARVALMDYYVGEGQSEALVCAVATDGERSAPWLLRYSTCNIEPQRLPLPRDHAAPLRDRALALIASGGAAAHCTVQ